MGYGTRYTASWSGKMPNASTITYYERDDGDFVPTHMTYAASSTATCEDGTAATGTDCPADGQALCVRCPAGYGLESGECVSSQLIPGITIRG